MTSIGWGMVVLGVIGWLIEGMYRLFAWAERHSETDTSAQSFPVLDDAIRTQEAVWHKLRWLWPLLIGIGLVVVLIIRILGW